MTGARFSRCVVQKDGAVGLIRRHAEQRISREAVARQRQCDDPVGVAILVQWKRPAIRGLCGRRPLPFTSTRTGGPGMSEVTNPPVVGGASVRAARRLSAIWIIPIVAVVIGLWLAWSTLSKEGPTITISFEGAEAAQAGQSQLKFRDFTLGTVRRLALARDHRHVLVTVATTREAAPLLTDTTIFWVEKPRLFAGNLFGLGTLISGSYIGMLPGAGGKAKREFVGHEDPPVLQTDVPGRAVFCCAVPG